MTIIGKATHENLYPKTDDARIDYLRTSARDKARRMDTRAKIRRNPVAVKIQALRTEIASMYESEEAASFYLRTARTQTREADAAQLRAEIKALEAQLNETIYWEWA